MCIRDSLNDLERVVNGENADHTVFAVDDNQAGQVVLLQQTR